MLHWASPRCVWGDWALPPGSADKEGAALGIGEGMRLVSESCSFTRGRVRRGVRLRLTPPADQARTEIIWLHRGRGNFMKEEIAHCVQISGKGWGKTESLDFSCPMVQSPNQTN